jgi:hypothetical protein
LRKGNPFAGHHPHPFSAFAVKESGGIPVPRPTHRRALNRYATSLKRVPFSRSRKVGPRARENSKRRQSEALRLGKIFGAQLEALRKRKRLPFPALAHRAGPSHRELIRIVSGSRQPNLQQLFNLATALGVSPARLVGSLDATDNSP